MPLESLEVDVCESLDAMEALEPQWQKLYDESREASVFQSPEWLLAFFRHTPNESPRLVSCRRGDRLVGLVPFSAHSNGEWSLAGTGPSDVLDLLARDEDREAVASAALAHIDRRKDWRALELHELREGSWLLKAARAGIAGEVVADGLLSVAPFLSIPSEAQSLSAIVPPRWAKRVRRDRRACERARLKTVLGSRPLDDVRAWARLHEARWRARGEPSALAGRTRFVEEAIPKLIERGRAELMALIDARGEVRASALFFREKTRAAYYLGGFDPTIARQSPLVVLLGAAVERFARSGAHELDFLRGGEPYKYRWGATDRLHHRVRVHPRHA